MAYTPNYSYNYNLPNIDLGALMNQGLAGASSLMGQRYAGEGQLQNARLQNALALQQGQLGESGRQFDVSTGLTREQIRYQQQQDQLAREAAEREMNWARSLNNPAVSGAVQRNIARAFDNPELAPAVALYRDKAENNQNLANLVRRYNYSRFPTSSYSPF